MELSLPVTAALAVIAAAITVFCGWRGAQPWDIRKGPRMMPWRFLMVLSFTLGLLMLVHALNLMGITTGNNPPRY